MPQGFCGATPRHRPAPAARRAWRIRPGTTPAPSVTIPGTFATPYQISVEPDWNTTCIYSGKATSQFTVTFGTPAPAGGGNVDWIVLSPAGVGEIGRAHV